VEDVVTVPNEVRVACPHGHVGTFASVSGGLWRLNMQGAKQVTYPKAGVTMWWREMRCDLCHVSVRAVKPDSYGPFLDGLVGRFLDYFMREGMATRVSPTVVEVPLDVMAAAAGAKWRLPDPKLLD
jgi:hypothetical protein